MKRIIAAVGLLSLSAAYGQKNVSPAPRLTLDQAFDYVQIQSVALSPDGNAVVIGTRRADWQKERFDRSLWLYRNGAVQPLTQYENDHDPVWSPDGKWISFLSNRPSLDGKKVDQIYLISATGGEAFPVTQGEENVDAFAWSPDSQTLYFATKKPLSKTEQDANKKEWHDVIQFRERDRGDVLFKESVSAAAEAWEHHPVQEPSSALTPTILASMDVAVSDMAVSPTGDRIAFTTESSSGRVEKISDDELFVVPSAGGPLRQLTHNEASESDVQWSPDGHSLLFHVGSGSIEGKYEEVQGRLYSLNLDTGKIERHGASFQGSLSGPERLSDGGVAALAAIRTEVQIYSERTRSEFDQIPGLPGTYASLSTAAHSRRVAFVFSAQQTPGEVYLADSLDDLRNAKPITSFNASFTRLALPRGTPYTWTADDGTKLEGWLIYPPGKFGAKHLRMLTLIHGGPSAADGNHFRSDWYDWAVLAASDDWLVFRPNYRGSVGYGDAFMRQISPHLVSRPGKDILEGVDALVRDGIADPDHLTVGGYSYGGYMTNWLITQTTRFRAAVTGAGAVEHAIDWGNDDLTFDDAWYLGGTPWQAEQNYNEQAAVWVMNRAVTPTHMVVGSNDIRVATAESYLLERELHTLGVPSKLLIFPGEGHLLANNPWHGKIKVREELKWLDRYSALPKPTPPAGNNITRLNQDLKEQ